MNNKLLRLRRLSCVPRWVTIPTIRPQSVAEHSFQVATLCMWLGPMHAAVDQEVVSMGSVLEAALCHEEIEAITGDTPSPAKQYIEGSGIEILENELNIKPYPNDAVKQIIKMADIMEAMLFLHEEMECGNNPVERVYKALWPYCDKRWLEFRYRERHINEEFNGSFHKWKPTAEDLFHTATEIFNPYKHPPLDHIS